MDLNKLRTLVFEKSGIKVDTSDPIFALVALNEAVLSECVEPHVAVLNDAADHLSAQTAQLLDASEKYRALLQRLGEVTASGGAAPLAHALAHDQRAAGTLQPAFGTGWTHWNWLAAAAGVALLSAILTVGMQSMISPKNTPAQVVPANPASTLTGKQVLLMENGEKYNKMWTRLDTKTQARIEALLRQP